ncbi:MAG TPA: aminotransferase class V-fold PLP-dependent enzyme, partial [bacterium]|nr:aminotransferase class V-fold PLP-dependent enzyme [bacterium]
MKAKKKTKSPKAVYLDCAATSLQKPPQVLRALVDYASSVGVSHGRGAYGRGLAANAMVYGTRAALGKLLGVTRTDRILFTKNVTEALNTALKGWLREGDHVVLSGLEHNAVIRPLNKLKAQ